MALGPFGTKDNVVSDYPPPSNALETEKSVVGNAGYGSEPHDPESLTAPRKGSRIDKAITKSIVPDSDNDDSSSGASVGKQMELEAGNAIQYRTCSWPKVRKLY